MMDSKLHIMVVVEAGHGAGLDWGRTCREAGERGAFLSLLDISGSSARWIVPAAAARAVRSEVEFRRGGDPAVVGVGGAVVDKIFEANSMISSITSTEVRLFGGSVAKTELSHAFKSDRSIRLGVFNGVGVPSGQLTHTPFSNRIRRVAGGQGATVETDLLRLVKVSAHSVFIVEVPLAGGDGFEYDPWARGEKWPAVLTWIDSGAMRIDIGAYHLNVTSDDDNVFVYRGEEEGPGGRHDFDVFGVSTDANELFGSQVREVIMIDQPPFVWDEPRSPKAPLQPRRVGCGRVSRGELPDRAGAVSGTVDEHMTFHGVHGGPDRTVRLKTFPTPERPHVQVRFDVESGERLVTGPHTFNPKLNCFEGGTLWFRTRPACH
jgi:hypothetical protein